MPFAGTWMDLGIVILSEVSQRQTYPSYVECNVKTDKMNLIQNRKLTDPEKELMGTKGEM